ncbi:YdeI/OmpD-associated family protein [Pedobacter montanisoli]|uniref:YdeI/OmpD-associated family protein n=1 Tax=Pedobacter montanisoli TaxID=2923277 RepID=A0ABS9ZVT0_9SPHI|nr:YdeI/OmpD-associated family protein [Pedobacter montanisoli]MCJ0742413.1 YdeI/OmpD-associated family protein [Pedobacter montanisoli]
MEKPLVNKQYLLEKHPGKGGWTYAAIPEVIQSKTSTFGWVKVKGSIDGFEFKNSRLQPMGNNRLFFPVRAEIRKKIKKQAGDFVHIILYADHDPVEVPEELLQCLSDHPLAQQVFLSYTEGEQKAFINWIYAAKTDDTKVERISQMLNKLEKGERLKTKQTL